MYRVLFVLLFTPALAWATLGEGPDSFEKDRVAMDGKVSTYDNKSALPAGVTVYQMEVGSITIREYADASGNIFAVSWHGITFPDLKPLLGKYHHDYEKKDRTIPRGRRYGRQPVKTPEITVTHGGHQPFLFGSAILNGKLPAGMTEADLL
jgi:hypothetical protein